MTDKDQTGAASGPHDHGPPRPRCPGLLNLNREAEDDGYGRQSTRRRHPLQRIRLSNPR
jgi:hypothetical protein